ncbi:hypothetical protein, partial [Methylobacterium ajmalii]|uniref:hypothetical protein n=1 Tax=Methylobacterium ajmalii TaxID=2738439 RepID=UPI00190E3847
MAAAVARPRAVRRRAGHLRHRSRGHRLGAWRGHLRLAHRLGLLTPHRILHLLLLALHHLLRLAPLARLSLSLSLSLLGLLADRLIHPHPAQGVVGLRRPASRAGRLRHALRRHARLGLGEPGRHRRGWAGLRRHGGSRPGRHPLRLGAAQGLH